MRRALEAFVLGVLLAGCRGPSVEEVCDGLVGCPEYRGGRDCEGDGQRAVERADEVDCTAELSDYLDCLDQAECSWRESCATARKAVESCDGSVLGP